MTYKEKYYEIINSGYKTKPETGYYEGHHIVPKSICPLLKKSQNNIVYLTAKNHFLAHYYIWKWFKEELQENKWARKMCFAFNMMKRIISKSEDIDELSKLYEEVRKDMIEIQKVKKLSEETKLKISERTKGRIPWNKGKKGIYTEETIRKMSDNSKGQIPWNKGKRTGLIPWNYGKHHSEDSRKKMSENRKGKCCGTEHPFYGRHHSEDSRKKISLSLIRKYLSNEVRNKILQTRIKFPVVQYTLDFKFVAEYESSREAERQTGITHTNINKCCKGIYYQANGYIWVYKDDTLYFF